MQEKAGLTELVTDMAGGLSEKITKGELAHR